MEILRTEPTFAYFTTQFLETMNPRRWKLALLAFDRIALPIQDLEYFTKVTEEERYMCELFHPNKKIRSPQQVVQDGINPYSLSLKKICEGDQGVIDLLKPFLSTTRDSGLTDIDWMFKLLDDLNARFSQPSTTVFHPGMLWFLEERLPYVKYNNFPWQNLVCVNDLIVGAMFLVAQRGSVFVDRHDLNVLYALSECEESFKCESLNPWVEELPFNTYAEFATSFLSNVSTATVEGLDGILSLQIPSFDDVPIPNLVAFKSKQSISSLVSLIREEWIRHPKMQDFPNRVAKVVQDTLWQAYDELKPSTPNILLAIAGAIPLGPLNPFSLISIGKEVFSYKKAKHDVLFVLNSLRKVTDKN